MQTQLAVLPAGTYQLVPQLSLNLVDNLCVPSVVIDGEPLDSSPLGDSSVAYAESAVSFGTQCTGGDAALAFLNKADALQRDDVQNHVEILSSIPGINGIVTQVLGFSMLTAILFLKDLKCGNFDVAMNSSMGVNFQGEDSTILNTALNPDAKYIAYVSYSTQGESPELLSFCSYTDTPFEVTSDGAPSLGGTYAGPEANGAACVPEVALSQNLVSPDDGKSWILNGPDILINGTRCTNDGALVFMLYKDAQESAALGNIFAKLQGSASLRLLDSIAREVPEEDLYAFTKSGALNCGSAETGSISFGISFEAKEGKNIIGLIGVAAGEKIFASASLSPGGNDALNFCIFKAPANSAPSPAPSGGSEATPTPTDGPSTAPTTAPTESSTAAPSSEPCFPASATVELDDGSRKRMDEIALGDKVRTAATNTFSEVFFFGHRSAEDSAEYVVLSVEHGHELSLSDKHYLYANGKLTTASNVHVGDMLITAHGKRARVLAVSKARLQGVYAPHTLHGDIIVNDVLASCYTQVVHPVAAHVLLAPLRAAYRLGAPMPKLLEKVSRAHLARALRLPEGPQTL
eukprot:Plantae.Rhodophyta-Purpureofilum_apyrenoidigerum.ctg5528.p1 GENE.Plantae.Rhodophyta-Purpureofilum_apyrenoidigerum.ctg5528~~Plantae.Rhodophyta-Purpureofilum_apyrenoidigerum.ctg5528.p1  ORF type:complete len:576 (-),score=102.35 Plantae.Rhodophyta-Purpureofilum_apyrenoidigerum.ctg5528:101-1828(-)